MSDTNQRVAIFGVLEADWDNFREMMVDTDSNFETWSEWKFSLDSIQEEVVKSGIDTFIVWADLEDFRKWCEKKKILKDGKARSEYAAHISKSRKT